MDDDLRQLTLAQLRELKAAADEAIRAVIRAKRLRKTPEPKEPEPQKLDLEQERDRWLQARRST